MTSKETARWLGERRGREFDPKDCLHRDGWVFWLDSDYGEVECVKPHPNDIWGEAYDAIGINASPFCDPVDAGAYERALADLNDSYNRG